MTLNQLYRKVVSTIGMFNTGDIPMLLDGKEFDIEFVPEGSNEKLDWHINVTIKGDTLK